MKKEKRRDDKKSAWIYKQDWLFIKNLSAEKETSFANVIKELIHNYKKSLN